jgi:alpha-L-fucosidase
MIAPLSAISRRQQLKTLLTASIAAVLPDAAADNHQVLQNSQPPPGHEQRIQWWREAKFGMFIHFGLYSILGREAWAMGDEDIPLGEYEQLAAQFRPAPDAARGWARLARASGMRYMVLTTKHHEGFCLFNSKLTDYCAPKHAAARDLVREFVEAARAEGLRVGFYYSLMDWHHPDWLKCREDAAAQERFVAYTHGQLHELLSTYGKVDILWYDMPVPLAAAGWRSEEMNRMVLQLQPEIVINNRNLLNGDFSTPEQSTQPGKADWESCMTMNDSWGYLAGDHNWKSPQQLLQNLVECARDGGNFLLNVGPTRDGTVPAPSVERLKVIGDWLGRNGECVYGTQRCRFPHGNIGVYTRKGNTLYVINYFWPGITMNVGGAKFAVKSARFLANSAPVKFEQRGSQLIFRNLPASAPDNPLTVIAVECDREAVQDALSSKADPSK